MAKAKKKTTKKRAKAKTKAKPEKPKSPKQQLVALLGDAKKLVGAIEEPYHVLHRATRPRQGSAMWSRPGYHDARRMLEQALDAAVVDVIPKIAAAHPKLTTADFLGIIENAGWYPDGCELLERLILGGVDGYTAKPGDGLPLSSIFGSKPKAPAKKTAKRAAKKTTPKQAAAKKKSAKAPKKAAKKAAAKPAVKTGTAAKKPRRSVADRVLDVLRPSTKALSASDIRSALGNVAGNRLTAALEQLVKDKKIQPQPGGLYWTDYDDAGDDQAELDELDDHVCDDDEKPEPESGQLSVVEG